MDRMNEIHEELGKYENVVLHYRCFNCGDEQVTYTMKTDEVRKELEEEKQIFIGLPCEKCGLKEKYIDIDNILEFENMDEYN